MVQKLIYNAIKEFKFLQLSLLHPERPKLHTVLVFLSAIVLNSLQTILSEVVYIANILFITFFFSFVMSYLQATKTHTYPDYLKHCQISSDLLLHVIRGSTGGFHLLRYFSVA